MSSVLTSKMVPSALPQELAVFPLTGALLLPQSRLPLNIFEPRYLAMIEDALGRGRMIGMIQPQHANGDSPPLYSVGCAGRISSFNETDDGHMLIVLTGICRFRVAAELQNSRLYRSVRPDWQPYLTDLGAGGESTEIDRARLIEVLQIYFKQHSIVVDWGVVQNAPNDVLVPTAIMICPLAANEKQALLEAPDFVSRARMLIMLLEMAVLPQADQEGEVRH